MFKFVRILLSARRLGIRDRGLIKEEYYEDPKTGEEMIRTRICTKCRGRARIAIREGRPVSWCWRCEAILDPEPLSHSGPNPGERAPKSAEHDTDQGGNVVPFGKRSA